MELIVTEVTDMGGNNKCVAGWDVNGQKMVRPLPDGHHWSNELVKGLGVKPGVVIDVTHNGHAHGGDQPHLLEDFEVDGESIKATGAVLTNWFNVKAPIAAQSVASGFGGHVRNDKEWRGVKQSVYVQRGTACPSLIGLNLRASALELVVPFDKLRVKIHDGQTSYEFPVSSTELQTAFGNGGLSAAKKVLPNFSQVHIRIGLARGYDRYPDKCFLMLNGVNW